MADDPTPGEALRDSLLADMRGAGAEPDSRETALLNELVAVENTLASLAEVIAAEGHTVEVPKRGTIIHPAVVEARLARLSKARLLSGLDLGTGKTTAASRHGRKASEKRWGPNRGRVDPVPRPRPSGPVKLHGRTLPDAI